MQPSQPPPANVYWVWILAIVVVAAVGTVAVYLRRPDAIARAGAIGPELRAGGHVAVAGGSRAGR